jgi:hypothetical protein
MAEQLLGLEQHPGGPVFLQGSPAVGGEVTRGVRGMREQYWIEKQCSAVVNVRNIHLNFFLHAHDAKHAPDQLRMSLPMQIVNH